MDKSLAGLTGGGYTAVTPSIRKPNPPADHPAESSLTSANHGHQRAASKTEQHRRTPTEKPEKPLSPPAPDTQNSKTAPKAPFPPGEIPIAARIKGPGPAAYALPSTIGGMNVHYMTQPSWKRSPMYTFGVKPAPSKPWIVPAPNSFFPACDRHGASRGPAFSMGAGFKKNRKDGKVVVVRSADEEMVLDVDAPGPGKYDPSIEGTSDVGAPKYSLTGRWRPENPRPLPGPQDYPAVPTIGPKPAPNLPAPPSYTIRRNHPQKVDNTSPGPAAYASGAETTMKASPAYSFGSRVTYMDLFTKRREHTVMVVDDPSKLPPLLRTVISHKGEGTTASDDARPKGSAKGRPVAVLLSQPVLDVPAPAPNTYDINEAALKAAKKRAPSFSFRVRHSEYTAWVPDP